MGRICKVYYKRKNCANYKSNNDRNRVPTIKNTIGNQIIPNKPKNKTPIAGLHKSKTPKIGNKTSI